MKKIIALLLILLVILPTLTISSFAYHTFTVDENNYNACFVYIVDGKAFFASNEAIEELKQTGKTTVYLPVECEGKSVYLKGTSNRGNYWGNEFTVPGKGRFWACVEYGPDVIEYSVDFVCSEDAEYDYERQIGTLNYLNFAGYSLGDTRIVFFSQNELDTALNDGVVYIEDTYLKENGLSFYDNGYGKFDLFDDHNRSNILSGGIDYSATNAVFRFEFEDGTNFNIYVNKDPLSDRIENCSCNCHKGGFMGFIWKIVNIFNKLFKSNKYCSCGVNHY